MLIGICGVFKKLKWLLIVIGILYLLSISAGMIARRSAPKILLSFIEKSDEQKNAATEKVFGRFRQAVKEGNIKTMAICSGLVFTFNLFGDFAFTTLPTILIFPIISGLLLGGFVQGISFAGLEATSSLSLFLFLTMGSLEWITYVIATVAGANIGLSVLFPKRQAASSRWLAFKSAWGDAGRLYAVIVCILALQAVFEILYVRKVLLMGGSAIPLLPY